MKTLNMRTWAVALGLSFFSLAQAQELKVGFVNTERVLRESTPARAAYQRLEAEFSKREKELATMANNLKTASEKLEKDAPTLSESEKTRRQREVVDQDRDFQRKKREFQEDINQRRGEELAAVQERAAKAVKQIFDTEKYDLILQDAVLFSARVDITDKVIKLLNNASGK
jgi:outer membrane protein